MKKIKTYLAMFAIITISANITMPSAHSANYSDQVFAIQKDSMWNLGKNLSVGDSYTFRICDPGAIPNYSAESYHYFTQGMDHNSSLCYVVKMDFVNLLDSDANEINRNIWVVQTFLIFGGAMIAIFGGLWLYNRYKNRKNDGIKNR